MAMDESDITLGPGKLLGLFFMLVAVCGVFFAIGYSLGKTSAREQSLNDKTALSASLGALAVGESNAAKPSAVVSAKSELTAATGDDASADKPKSDMTFYEAVKKTDRSSQPASTDGAQAAASQTQQERTVAKDAPKSAKAQDVASVKPVPDVTAETKGEIKAAATPTAGAFVVQIAAVSREEDAAALAGALRKKSYSVFVVNNPAAHDKFYHVQVGPFATQQDADAMKVRLTGEGYNPIVKHS